MAHKGRFGEQVHCEVAPDKKAQQRLSVGPLEESWDELSELAKDLFAWVGEGFSIAALRKQIAPATYEVGWKQLKLIEALMSGVLRCEQVKVVSVVGPLKDLNGLRVGYAHNLAKPPQALSFNFENLGVRESWFLVVDGVEAGLDSLSDCITQ